MNEGRTPLEELKPPKLIDPYQLISTDNGVVISLYQKIIQKRYLNWGVRIKNA